MSDSLDSAYGPSVGTVMPSWKRTVLAWLPSASPSALTSSPDFLRSSSSLPMNRIISTIHSLPMVASPASADPNVMIMYFTSSLLFSAPPAGALTTGSEQWRRSRHPVGKDSGTAHLRGRHPPVPACRIRQLVETRHRAGALPREVQGLHPVRVVHGLGEGLAAAVLLQLEVEAGQLPDQQLEDALTRAPHPVSLFETLEAGQQLLTELVHDQVAVALHERHRPLHLSHHLPLRWEHAGKSGDPRCRRSLPARRIEKYLERLLHMRPQPRVRCELPGVRHLVEDQPPPQVLAWQLGLLGPFLDVGLDQVEAVGGDGLRTQELRVVLAQDPSTQEPEHEADVAIDPGATDLDDQRVRDTALLENRVDDPAQDVEVEIEPALAIDRLKARQLDTGRQPAHEVEQWLLEFGGHRAVALLGWGQRGGVSRRLLQARTRGVPNLVPVDQHRRATAGTDGFGDRRRGEPGEHAVHRRPTYPSPHISRVRKQSWTKALDYLPEFVARGGRACPGRDQSFIQPPNRGQELLWIRHSAREGVQGRESGRPRRSEARPTASGR